MKLAWLIPQETARTWKPSEIKEIIMSETKATEVMRTFESGATRGAEAGKLDYEGFFSPLVLERWAQYLDKHRIQADGNVRASDNWQKGIPDAVYMKSAWRHFLEVWKYHRGLVTVESEEDNLCAVLFNIHGKLHEILKKKAQFHL